LTDIDIIRFVTGDYSARQTIATNIFRQIHVGGTMLHPPTLFVADTVYAPPGSRLYHLPHKRIMMRSSHGLH